jgi:hypothetical protein
MWRLAWIVFERLPTRQALSKYTSNITELTRVERALSDLAEQSWLFYALSSIDQARNLQWHTQEDALAMAMHGVSLDPSGPRCDFPGLAHILS